MKRHYSLLFLLFLCMIATAQKGTIKIKKPAEPEKELPQLETPAPPRMQYCFIDAGANYTFKQNNKIGSYASLSYGGGGRSCCGFSIGLGYSQENVLYGLSGYNSGTHVAEEAIARSHTESVFATLPIGVHGAFLNGRTVTGFVLGIEPKYLLSVKNEHDRLGVSDMNRLNMAWKAKLIIPLGKRFDLGLAYSRDFFQNLKNRRIDSSLGTFMGFQRSKTGMVSISLSARFRRLI
jgi:hypothetical protein